MCLNLVRLQWIRSLATAGLLRVSVARIEPSDDPIVARKLRNGECQHGAVIKLDLVDAVNAVIGVVLRPLLPHLGDPLADDVASLHGASSGLHRSNNAASKL